MLHEEHPNQWPSSRNEKCELDLSIWSVISEPLNDHWELWNRLDNDWLLWLLVTDSFHFHSTTTSIGSHFSIHFNRVTTETPHRSQGKAIYRWQRVSFELTLKRKIVTTRNFLIFRNCFPFSHLSIVKTFLKLLNDCGHVWYAKPNWYFVEAVQMFDSIVFPPVVTACHNYSETESQQNIIIFCASSL